MGLSYSTNEEKSMFGGRSAGYNYPRKHVVVNPLSATRLEAVITAVYFTGKMPSCDVQFVKGGEAKFLAFPGGKLDEVTGLLHGDFIQPTIGQRVIIGFTNGDIQSPYISELIFRAGDGAFSARYKIDLQLKYSQGDIIRGHKSGAIQIFKNLEIFTGFESIVDPFKSGSIIQSPSGVILGDGGKVGLYQEVACANVNYVTTSLGPMPILESKLTPLSPRFGIGTSLKA